MSAEPPQPNAPLPRKRRSVRRLVDREFSTWPEFVQYVFEWSGRSIERQQPGLFRGQPNSRWRLVPTLDRLEKYPDDESRTRRAELLASQYGRQIRSLHGGTRVQETFKLEELEMHGRHHGLPTRLLDWTESPLIAAFFAFDALRDLRVEDRTPSVTIWRLWKPYIGESGVRLVEIVEADERLNERAVAQRSVFTRLVANRGSVNAAVPNAVARITIPAAEARTALSFLDQANINPSTMYPGHDGAARTVVQRFMGAPSGT